MSAPARSGTATITVVGPAPYDISFDGKAARVHVRGHLWLKADSPGFTITFALPSGTIVFDDGSFGHGVTGPIYTGRQPGPGSFDACGVVFTNPQLVDALTLQLTISNNDHNKYYYQLNFVDTSTNPLKQFHTDDPIIVNN